ncbi:MAG: hypothetical protein HND58_05050 [Planctomycetota bacterium]|nr:MAG: hypothetical protein HND58_05050 [Planctomycetota bacterium]
MSAPPPPNPLDKPNNPFGTGTTWEDALDYWPTRVKTPKPSPRPSTSPTP